MFYKILYDGKIIDACTELNYVKWSGRNQMFVSCSSSEADGVISSNDKEIFLFESSEITGNYKRITYSEITKEVYDEIRKELDDGDPIDDDPEPETEPVVKHELVERLETLEGMSDLLTECILEMSEIIYAE